MRRVALLFLIVLPGCIKDSAQIPSTNASYGPTAPGPHQRSTFKVDPLAAEAWHLKNTGQKTFSTGPGITGQDIMLLPAFDLGVTGHGVRIAVSDTGTEVDHPDLNLNQLSQDHRSYLYHSQQDWRNSSPYPSDSDPHGTAVTGIIAALRGNGLGSHGVSPEAQFASFRFIMNYGASVTQSSMLAKTIDQTAGDFDIFNYSYGYTDCQYFQEDPLVNDAIEVGVTSLRNGKGAIYVQAAGNSFSSTIGECLDNSLTTKYAGNTNVTSDLASPHKIIVSSVNAQGVKSSYATPGSGIWVAAPGGEYGLSSPAILTTDLTSCNVGYSFKSLALDPFNSGRSLENLNCNYTSLMNGSSSAAPITSGVIALMLEANPDLSWRDVKHILALTSDPIDYSTSPLIHPNGLIVTGYDYDYKWTTNGAGYNYSNWYGFGRINAYEAVRMAQNYDFPLRKYEKTSNPHTKKWYYNSGTLSLSIPDGTAIPIEHGIEVLHHFIVEAVQIKVTIDHPAPQDLAIHLVSPAGTESRLLNINSGIYSTSLGANKLLLSNSFYGEPSLGTWKIKVHDGFYGDEGTIKNWQIHIHGRKIIPDYTPPYPPGFISMNATYGSGSSTPTVTFSPSNSLDLSRYEVSIGSAPGLSDLAPWHSVGKATSFTVHGLALFKNKTYFANARAVDQMENVSSSVSASWKVSY
jgi:subtilisin-like proprotein convertase family protein